MSQKTPIERTAKKNRSGFAAIAKKEFTRFFTDKRMVFTVILLPGLLIFALYSFMGTAMQGIFSVDEDYQPVQYAVNMPSSVDEFIAPASNNFDAVGAGEIDSLKQQITDQEVDLLVVFPEGFDTSLANAYEDAASYEPPLIEIYYNSARTESSVSYSTISTLLDAYKNSQFNLFSINSDGGMYDLASERDASGFMISMLLPLLMMMFIFSGCMSIAPESIAGEKERGTIATLLVTPLKRWELAFGKIVSISCIALLSGLSSFIGTILSLPRLFGGAGDSFSLNIYGVQDYLLLLAVILSTVLLFVGLISIISTFAKTIKEATSAVTPLMIVVVLVGVSGMFSSTAQTSGLFYLIPAYNSVQSMVGILTFNYEPINIAITVVANVVVAGICVFVLTKMFNSEKVIFSR